MGITRSIASRTSGNILRGPVWKTSGSSSTIRYWLKLNSGPPGIETGVLIRRSPERCRTGLVPGPTVRQTPLQRSLKATQNQARSDEGGGSEALAPRHGSFLLTSLGAVIGRDSIRHGVPMVFEC